MYDSAWRPHRCGASSKLDCIGDMALSAGNRIGSYTIPAPLGAGGMGEVYRQAEHDVGLSAELLRRTEQWGLSSQSIAHYGISAKLDEAAHSASCRYWILSPSKVPRHLCGCCLRGDEQCSRMAIPPTETYRVKP